MSNAKQKRKKASTRRYDSSSRQAAAEENRNRLARAARQLFCEHGYTATTITQIADGAGLASQTVYGTFGSKPAILEFLIASALNTPDEPAFQDWMIAATSAPTATERIEKLAEGSTLILERAGDLFAVLSQARYTNPELVPLWDQGQARRMDGIMRFVTSIRDDGLVPDHLDTKLAIDAIWTLASPETFVLLTTQREWTTRQYRDWLSTVIAAEVKVSYTL